MITISATIFLIFFIYLLLRHRVKYSFENQLLSILITLVYLIFIVISIGNVEYNIELSRTNKSVPIVSLKNESTSWFYLGSRTLGKTEEYLMFYKTPRNTVARLTLPTDRSEIIEKNNEIPRVEWQEVTYRQSRFWIYIPFYARQETRPTVYNIIVPENTVIEQFKVD